MTTHQRAEGASGEPVGRQPGGMTTHALADEAETRALGRELALRAEPGDVIALDGTLGAGKTCLSQGFAEGLGIPARTVNSPTFALWNIHTGRLTLHHMDWYRIADPDEALVLGLEDVVGVDGVCLVEWPSRLPHLLPADTLQVELTFAPPGRLATLRATGLRGLRLMGVKPG